MGEGNRPKDGCRKGEKEMVELHYKGKFSGNVEELPQREHPQGAVKFKEAENPEALAKQVAGWSFVVLVYVISICVVFILITAVMAAFGGLWWMAGVALTELCGFSILATKMVKGKNSKNKKRGERYGNQK